VRTFRVQEDTTYEDFLKCINETFGIDPTNFKLVTHENVDINDFQSIEDGGVLLLHITDDSRINLDETRVRKLIKVELEEETKLWQNRLEGTRIGLETRFEQEKLQILRSMEERLFNEILMWSNNISSKYETRLEQEKLKWVQEIDTKLSDIQKKR